MIIGLCGAARSGKDTVADLLSDFFSAGRTYRVQISGPLKAICRDVFDWTMEHTDGKLKDVPDERYPRTCATCGGKGKIQVYLTYECPTCNGTGITCLAPREAMQQLGGEFAETTFPAIWAVKAARTAATLEANGLAIVTDCRFIRDIKAVKDVGGVIIQTHRKVGGLTGEAAKHRSETERKSPEFQAMVDHHIYNHSTLEDLRDQVRDFCVLEDFRLTCGTGETFKALTAEGEKDREAFLKQTEGSRVLSAEDLALRVK